MNRLVISGILIVTAGSAILAVLGYEGFFNTSTFSGTTVHFTIIEASSGPLEGMNGSYYHPLVPPPYWPVINVTRGERVMVHVVNNSTSEPHGFAIRHYFDAGASIGAGKSYDLTFIADQAGSFRMYCNINCSIHPFMQNGLLTVM